MEHKAGRELDKLIAEKIFGIKVEARNIGFLEYEYVHTALNEKTSGHITNRIPMFSTDIAAAWRVVEKLKLFDKNRLWSEGGFWMVGCEDPYTGAEYVVRGVTAPEAICLAALEAVGETGQH